MIDISKAFDSYNRVARLYPALLILAPLIWTICSIHPDIASSQPVELLLSTMVFIGGFVLLSNLARTAGKSIEEKLNQGWGGWRTTTLLRHQDSTIDRFTKLRYHAALQKLSGNTLQMPTPDQEILDPHVADEKYRSATKLLIEKRRDKKYDLLQKELAWYGFRRNLLGLKPIGVVITVIAILINLFDWYQVAKPSATNISFFLADIVQRGMFFTPLLASMAYLLLFIFVINENFVRQSADEYSLALFRTLENEK